jgi:hypothetical protein
MMGNLVLDMTGTIKRSSSLLRCSGFVWSFWEGCGQCATICWGEWDGRMKGMIACWVFNEGMHELFFSSCCLFF